MRKALRKAFDIDKRADAVASALCVFAQNTHIFTKIKDRKWALPFTRETKCIIIKRCNRVKRKKEDTNAKRLLGK